MELGFFGSVLKITLHTLHHVLHLSALSFLLLYLLKAVSSFPSFLESFYSVMPMLFPLFWMHPPRSNRATLTPPTLCRDILTKLCFTLYSVCVAIILNNDYTPAGITELCTNFAIVSMLGTVAATLYTALASSRSAANYGDTERWLNLMIKCCMDGVWASKLIAGAGAALLLIFAPGFSLQSAAALIGVRSTVIWSWAAAGLICVAMLPLVSLCAVSTLAVIYLACKKHHEERKSTFSPHGQVVWA